MVAVYATSYEKVVGLPLQLTDPLYCWLSMACTGVPPVTGWVTPLMAGVSTFLGASTVPPVDPNAAVIVPESGRLVTNCAFATSKKLAGMPCV